MFADVKKDIETLKDDVKKLKKIINDQVLLIKKLEGRIDVISIIQQKQRGKK